MQNNMQGLIKNQRKPRRRTHRRKLLPSDSPMDMAEARREIVNALQIHRSSFSLRDHQEITTATSLNLHTNNNINNNNTCSSSSSSSRSTTTGSQLYYPLVESVRFPEPIWSTTEPTSTSTSPSLSPFPYPYAAATSAELDDQEVVLLEEFEWPESNRSSYTWWLGFLRSLDSSSNNNNNNNNEEYVYGSNNHIQTSSAAARTTATSRTHYQSSAFDESELLRNNNIMASLSTAATNQNEQNPPPEATAAAAYHDWSSIITGSDQDNEVEI